MHGPEGGTNSEHFQSVITQPLHPFQDTLPDDPKMWANFEAGCYENQVGTQWILGHGHSIWAMLTYIDKPGSIRVISPSEARVPKICQELHLFNFC